MFAIVQGKKCIEVIPENWIVSLNGQIRVMWPPQNLRLLQADPRSKPILCGDNQWIIGDEKVKARGFDSFKLADEVCKQMNKESDSESDLEHIARTRNRPAKPLGTSRSVTIPSITLPEQIFASPAVRRCIVLHQPPIASAATKHTQKMNQQ